MRGAGEESPGPKPEVRAERGSIRPPPDPSDVAASLHARAVAVYEEGGRERARATCRRALRLMERAIGPQHPDVAAILNSLAAIAQDRGEYGEAEGLLVSGYEGMRERQDQVRFPNKVLTETLQNLIQLFEATGRAEKAAECKTKLAVVQAAGPKGKPAWPKLFSNDQAGVDH